MIEENKSSSKHYKKLADVLGKKNVKREIESPFDFINLAKEGINVAIIKNFSNYFDLSKSDTADLLDVSEPTLYRWAKQNKNLERNHSIRIFEITDLFLYGIEVFESKENFFKWLSLPNTALGGMEPMELVEIPDGLSKVRDIIGRIEHGVYS